MATAWSPTDSLILPGEEAMKQILQSPGSGETELAEVPVRAPAARSLLVESRASVVAAGTEQLLVDFGRSNLLGKVRKQPEKVRQVGTRCGPRKLARRLWTGLVINHVWNWMTSRRERACSSP